MNSSLALKAEAMSNDLRAPRCELVGMGFNSRFVDEQLFEYCVLENIY